MFSEQQMCDSRPAHDVGAPAVSGGIWLSSNQNDRMLAADTNSVNNVVNNVGLIDELNNRVL